MKQTKTDSIMSLIGTMQWLGYADDVIATREAIRCGIAKLEHDLAISLASGEMSRARAVSAENQLAVKVAEKLLANERAASAERKRAILYLAMDQAEQLLDTWDGNYMSLQRIREGMRAALLEGQS